MRKLVNRETWNMISGQIINVLLPLTLPWIFILLRGGIRNYGTKLNSGCFALIHFFVFVFPLLYLLSLLQERRNLLAYEQ